MPTIRPISDLRNNSSEIAEFCKSSHEPVFITKNGIGELAAYPLFQKDVHWFVMNRCN